MSVSANATYLTNLVDPEVIGALLERKLADAIKFAPLCNVDATLTGVPGSTIKLPYFRYISMASVTAEGQPITINQLQSTTVDAQIKKCGNGVEITDEAVLSGYGDPIGEAANQLALSIADRIDQDVIEELDGATKASATTAGQVVANDIADGLVSFGEDIDGDKVVLVAPSDYARIRKDSTWVAGSDIGADIIIKGVVGMVHGCQVAVSNRVPDGVAYIVKPQALSLFIKRDTAIESDRDIINKTTVMTADKHYVAKLVNPTKAVLVSGYPVYSKKTYSQNDVVIYMGHTYKAKEAISPADNTFTAAHWDLLN